MNQEFFPKMEKRLKEADEMPDDESLFDGLDSLWSPTLEGVERLGKEFSEYPEFKPRLTFPFPLDRQRREAIKALRTGESNEKLAIDLLKSDDFVKRGAGGFLLKKIKGLSEKSIVELRTTLENKEWKEKNGELAEKIKVKIILETQKDNAFDVLAKMTEDKNWETKMAAVEGLGELGDERALSSPILIKLLQNPSAIDPVIDVASKAITKIMLKAKRGRNVIETLILREKTGYDSPEGEGQATRDIIMDSAEKEGEKAVPWLKEMCQDKNGDVSRPAAQALARLIIKKEGKKADELLKETFKDYDGKIKEAVDFEKNKHQWLSGTQKSIFAPPNAEALIEGVNNLREIIRQLKERVGDKFIVFNILGSASKGYFAGEDIDFEIIAEKEAAQELGKFTSNVNIKCDLVEEIIIDKNNNIADQECPIGLFRGFLIGDYKDYRRLTKIQKNFLEKAGQDRWNKTRKYMIDFELYNFHKLSERFGLTSGELENLEWVTVLSRIPPTYDETRKIIDKRYRKLKDIKGDENENKKSSSEV